MNENTGYIHLYTIYAAILTLVFRISGFRGLVYFRVLGFQGFRVYWFGKFQQRYPTQGFEYVKG